MKINDIDVLFELKQNKENLLEHLLQVDTQSEEIKNEQEKVKKEIVKINDIIQNVAEAINHIEMFK